MASKARATDTYRYQGKGQHHSDRIAIIVSKWHPEITDRLYGGALEVLEANGVEYTLRQDVPGSFELPLAVRLMAEMRRFDAILVFGCVIKGETRHDEYLNHAVTNNLLRLGLKLKLPVLNGVLTVETLEQARQRVGGTQGHKGKECAIAALEMIDLVRATKGQ
jgi:6,7-dimethyl-8-ribityllumazine synthase